MSREVTVTDAVNYIQELERQKEMLQKELQGMADEATKKQGSNSGTSIKAASQVPLHCKEGVEMRTLGRNGFLAGVVCRSRKGAFTEMVEAVGSLGLEVTDTSFLSVDGASQIMLCMELSKACAMCSLSSWAPAGLVLMSTVMKSGWRE